MSEALDRFMEQGREIGEAAVTRLLESFACPLTWSPDGWKLLQGDIERGKVSQISRGLSPEYYWIALECSPMGIPLTMADDPVPTKEQAQWELLAFVAAAIEARKAEAAKP